MLLSLFEYCHVQVPFTLGVLITMGEFQFNFF